MYPSFKIVLNCFPLLALVMRNWKNTASGSLQLSPLTLSHPQLIPSSQEESLGLKYSQLSFTAKNKSDQRIL